MPNGTDKINTFLKGPDFLNNDTYPNFEKPTQPESEEETNEIKSADVLVGTIQKKTGKFDTTSGWALLELRKVKTCRRVSAQIHRLRH